MSANSDEPAPQNGVEEPELKPIEEPATESEPKRKPEPQSKPNSEPKAEAEPQPEPAPASVADREPDVPKEASIRSNDDARSSPSAAGGESAYPELRKDHGNRTFTMRELLNGLKTDQGSDGAYDTPSPYSQESPQQQQTDQNNAAMDLINSVTGVDEDSRSRQRVLTFAAKRYASAIERNPEDYDALYNWALVLQESADNVSADSTSPSKDALLEEACKKYDEATHLCPTLHDAFYNWAIAISDRAKMRGRTKEAEELWKQATKNYEKAVQLNWNSPQALNNWGLALQELSAIVPAREKQTIVRTAISKFRAAIQLQFDFHRAIYNLGTVLYGLAEDTLRTGGSGNPKDVSPNELYSQSAIYIAAAHALKPNYSIAGAYFALNAEEIESYFNSVMEFCKQFRLPQLNLSENYKQTTVYTSALRLVRSMLPLPYLKVGYLTAPPVGKPVAPHNEWKRSQFVLNHEGLHQISKGEQRQVSPSLFGRSDAMKIDKRAIKVDVPDIVSVSACADLTLPPGAGLCIDTIHGTVFLVADSWESLDGWLDAIRIVYTIYARNKSDVLAGIITG